MRDIIELYPSPTETRKKILASIISEYGVTLEELKSKRRLQKYVIARHEAMRRLRDELGYSYKKIGMIFGERDHSSVIYGIGRARERLADASEAE